MTTKFVWQSAWKQLWHATSPPPPPSILSATAFPRRLTAASAFAAPHPFSSFFSTRIYGATSPLRSPRYVLQKGFTTGLVAWSIPAKASEAGAVVSSCSGSSTVDRTLSNVSGRRLRDKKQLHQLYPFAKSTWNRGICSDCRKDGIVRQSRRSSSSKTNGKPNGDGKPSRKNGNGDKDFARNGRAVHNSNRLEHEKSHGKYSESRQKNGKAVEKPDKEEQPKTLAAAAAAIAKRAARDHGFMERLPEIHRPSYRELLAAASSFWDRLRIRFKWHTIRQIRPFNIDEISAFFSWIVLGHLAWIILGTTTFFSLAIWFVNTFVAQGILLPDVCLVFG